MTINGSFGCRNAVMWLITLVLIFIIATEVFHHFTSNWLPIEAIPIAIIGKIIWQIAKNTTIHDY